MTCAILARLAASLRRFTFCWGVSFLGAGSANCKVVARPPGRVCAQTPVAVKRVASLTCLDILPLCGGVVGVEVGLAGGIGKSWEVGIMD